MPLLDALRTLVGGADLTADEASEALAEIVDGEVPASVVAAFLIALRMKGETAEEIAGLARTMLAHAVPVRPQATGLVDTVGTGGDGAGTVNISTTTAFVVAGAGLPVAKHGNRSITSKSGSADVLEALGVRLDLSGEQVARCIDDAGIGFMFAPAFHPAMAKVMPVRRELGVRTAFNLLGPLTNPARPSFQLVGVGDRSLVHLIAGALAELGVERALVVHGEGTDELTCGGDNVVLRVERGRVTESVVRASDAGLPGSPVGELEGGTPQENADQLRAILDGKPGPQRDCVLFNAAGAFVAAGRVDDFAAGVEVAREAIDSGAAAASLARLVEVCASL
jgi:anthranilate phosphoribosyltransferase